LLDPSKPAHVRAEQRLRSETIAWLTTVRADGQAQSSPVWFLWDGESFLVYSQPHVQKVRNLAANPKVSLHLGDDGAGIQALGSEPGPFARTYSTAIRVRPTRVRAW
jgi:general stress protein 26